MGMQDRSAQVREAYAECRKIARRHYENFPTASLLVPREKRDALAAVYAFARHADDLADEPGVENRLGQLAEWRQKLTECFAGRAEHPVFVALRDASARWELSEIHFQNLLRAFEQDIKVNRHKDFASLLAYCKCSANPVGRLVLELFGHCDEKLFELSDHVCTALQLTNFWQDVAIDHSRDRIYLPLDDMARFGYSLDDLAARRTGEAWSQLLGFEAKRTWELFEKGKPLTELVEPKLRRQLRLTWLGGTTILRKTEEVGYDVFQRRPKLGKVDFLRLYWRSRSPL
jgi:hydroxysqualene synthase